ncbi:MAG: sulfate transporter CysZ [Gammaproteobacteria bacterium]|nr:sulfate transporter CysZ [Gammaproteobacteria bacterium]
MNSPQPSYNNPISGMKSLFSGLPLMSKTGIKSYVLIPLLINIALFFVALLVGIHYFSLFMSNVLDFSNLWNWVAALLNLIKPILWVLFFIIYLTFVFYTFSLFANIIASPFNTLLAEATENYLIGNNINANSSLSSISIKQIISLSIKSIAQEIHKLVYFLIRAIPLLILFLIPITMPFAPILWFAFSAWMMSLQYMDYPFGNHDIKFNHQISMQKQKRWFSLGFGSAVLLMTMIPVINFMIMPLAVISATKNSFNNFNISES